MRYRKVRQYETLLDCTQILCDDRVCYSTYVTVMATQQSKKKKKFAYQV